MRRRRALLTELNVPIEGSVQLATRVDGVPAAQARRRAHIGAVVLASAGAVAIAALSFAAALRIGPLVPVGIIMLIAVLGVGPPNRERRGASARHGKSYQLLSVRTRTGIRTLHLSQILRVEQRPRGVWALDAQGVTVRVTSKYARQAVKRGVERWGVAQAAPSSAALRVLARCHIWTLMRHPKRDRGGELSGVKHL